MSNWNKEREDVLTGLVGSETPVSLETVARAADELEVTPRSVSAKLRKMGFEVEKVGERGKAFSDEQEAALVEFLNENHGEYTYGQIAEAFAGGAFSPKQIQGKVLSLEMTGAVAPTPPREAVTKYTAEEEETFLRLVRSGAFLEDIADAMDRSLASVRGKALSLSRKYEDVAIPKQRESYAQTKTDALDTLGDISNMTVAEIAEAIGKTPRGVKTMITHRGLECADYKAKKKKEAA
jgi:hypothetical protein